ncbi:hypothetical protein [Microbacterium maritypicum]
MDEEVTISLTMDEALVLFEWLATANEQESLTVDAAERRVLWDVESMLEPQLPMLLSRDYDAHVASARRALSEWESE